MVLALTYNQRRRLHWKCLHCWSCIRLHKRLVIVSALLGTFVGIAFRSATPAVYAGRVVIESGRCPHGLDISEAWLCSLCNPPPERSVSALVEVARKLDRAALAIGFTNLHFERYATNFLAE
jgi:hypothetical protein